MYGEPFNAAGMISASSLLRSCDQPVNCVTQAPRIPDAIRRLNVQVEMLAKSVIDLREKLVPVLKPVPRGTPLKDKSQPPPLSPLHLELDNLSDGYDRLLSEIHDLASSIEL